MQKTITIAGCGWLGLPLAEQLVHEGWRVLGTTTSEDKIEPLRQIGIESHIMRLPSAQQLPEEIFRSPYVVINIPPGRKNASVADEYPEAIRQITAALHPGTVQKIIFVSSTSVFGDAHTVINESTALSPTRNSGRALVQAEQQIQAQDIESVILRFGGLAGPGRHPGRFFAGKTDIAGGHKAVNFVHLHDAVAVIHYLLHSRHCGIFNVAAPEHPTKDRFYTAMSERLGEAKPIFADAQPDEYIREISSEKLLTTTGFRFQHPDPMRFFEEE